MLIDFFNDICDLRNVRFLESQEVMRLIAIGSLRETSSRIHPYPSKGNMKGLVMFDIGKSFFFKGRLNGSGGSPFFPDLKYTGNWMVLSVYFKGIGFQLLGMDAVKF